MKRSNIIPLVLVGVVAVTGLTFAALASTGKTTLFSNNSNSHNAADVAFAQDMIPHHSQAIVMAKLATTRANSPEVKALAKQIEAAQDPEITLMTNWLKSWNEPITASSSNMHGQPAATHGGSGMMADDDIMDLMGSTGVAFDRMFLEMMIAHHEGAIKMANVELSAGQYTPAKELATAIIKGQTEEIILMKKLLTN